MSGPAVLRWRGGDAARLAYAALAVGELIADKLPATPNRTIPPALAFRTLSGGFCGRSVAVSFDGDRRAGIFAGAVGAVLASYGGMFLRTQITHRTGIPDPIVALFEDGLAIYGAIAASQP